MKIKDVICCWDFILAIIITILMKFLLNKDIDLKLAIDLYSLAISVLSIIFSVFFAALTVIISTSEDDFVYFLSEDNIYKGIIETFKFTLLSIFITLIYTIVVYFLSRYSYEYNCHIPNIFLFYLFAFMFLYSLFAVFNATLDSIIYAQKRIEYVNIKKKNK